MGSGNFTEDFRLDAIKQITEQWYSVASGLHSRLNFLLRIENLQFHQNTLTHCPWTRQQANYRELKPNAIEHFTVAAKIRFICCLR
jgi:hypothetical protein